MANNTFNFKGVFDVRDVLKGIDQIKEDLGKLALGPGLESEFNKLFNNIQKQADKANAAMASGFKNRGDVTNYTNAMDQIVNSYDRIITKLKILKADGKITLQADTSEFEKLGKELDDLNKKLKGFASEMSKASDSLDKIGQKRGKGTKNVASWENAIYAFKNGDIQGTTRALNTLKGMMTKATNNGVDFDKDKTWKQFKADFDALTMAMKDYDAASKAHNQAQAEFDAKEQRTQQILADTEKEIDNIQGAMEQSAEGVKKFANESKGAATQSQQLNSELEHFRGKAAYFFGLSNAINLFKRAIRSAYDTVKDLDAVMTETAVVTDFDVGDMWSQLPEYTQRANELGVSIHSAYEAATIFYQQGLKTNEVMAISNETLKMARIAGLDAATASDRMTNALRGFNMELDKTSAQRVNDVYSKLAAITASDTDEISTAMTKVASLAHNANMEFETTAAFLAQIIESTRESAETAGTALKTVVARFSEVKKLYSKGELLGQDEEGEEIDVNKVSTALRSAGINLNEYLTGAKGLDDIFIELAEKWDSLDQVQQRYIATMAAGSRQQSRFIALMSDYKRTAELVDAANNANGASQEQYNKTLESLETKLSRLKNAWDEFVLGLANSDAIKGAVDLLTELITAINSIINLVSGGNSGTKMITTFFAAFTAFKIGKAAIGKNSAMTSFFGKLVGDGEIVAKGSAQEISKTFFSNLAESLVKFKKEGGISGKIGDSIEGVFKDAKAFLTPDPDAFKEKLFNSLDPKMSNDDFDAFWETIDKTDLTVGELNEALEKAGSNFRITEDNAQEFGLALGEDTETINGFTSGMQKTATVCTLVGGAMMAVGGALEDLDGPAKYIGIVIKNLGMGLMAFGTIMSVYIPLRAQLMAQGVTSAIVSIPIVGWIAGVISALIALGGILFNIGKENSAQAKLEKVAEYADAAADAADEAREAYEKLGEAWENLSDKYEVIDNAVKGTQEWRDAVKEVNDAVLQLMDTYDGISIKRDENGILQIENQEEVDTRLKDVALNAEANERISKIRELQELQNSILGSESENAIDHKAYEEVIATLRKNGNLETATPEEIEKLFNDFFATHGGEQIDAEPYVQNVRDYIKSLESNKESMGAQYAAFGGTILDKAGLDRESEKYANAFLNDQYLEELIRKTTNNVESDTSLNIQEEYARVRGYANYETYKNNNPDEDIKQDQMQKAVIDAMALDEGAKQIEAFANNIRNADGIVQALFSEQEGGGLTREQAFDLQSRDKAELYDDFGKYMFDTQEAFNEWLNNTLKTSLNAFDTTQYGEEFNDNLWKFAIEGLSSDTYKSYVEDLWSIYSTSGEGAMNRVQQSVKDMTRDMDAGQAEEFYKRITEINWASVDSIKSLDALADEFGISEDVIKAFENQIIELNNAVAQFDAEKLASALGLASKISSGEQGRSFSKEAYETAIANGANENDFVYNINTDAYDYIGKDIQDVRTAILQQTDTLRGSLEKQVGSNEAVEKLAESGKLVTNPDSYAQIRAFLTEYQSAAGNNSMISQDFLQTASEDQIRAKYEEIMQQYYQRTDTQAKLDQANAYRYQANTGTENAARAVAGDEQAEKTLKQQLANSDLSEEEKQRLLSGMNDNPSTSWNYVKATNNAGGVVDTLNEAKQYGISTEDLEAYVTALRTVDDLQGANEATLYALALANANYQEGFKGVIESYDKWIELKQEDGSIRAEDGNTEQLKTFAQLKQDLKQMFNLTEDVSDEFLKLPETAELLERAVDGDTNAVSELRASLAKSQLVDLGIDPNSEIFNQVDAVMAEAGTLEFGADLDAAPAMQKLKELMEASGFTVDQMAKIFGAFGWAPEVTMKEVPVTEAMSYGTEGHVEVVDPITGEKTVVTADNIWQHSQDGMVLIPEIGNATFTPPDIPSFTPSTKDSGGGGGGSSEKKPSYWENPYDELYNLQEKINESLRTREALERRYQKLLKQEQATLKDIRKSYYAQINQLSAEAELQKQFAAGRLRQIDKLGSELYTDSEGDRSSFSSWGVTKYASYDKDTGLIQIDWEGLEAIANDSDREEEGKAAEAYISKLEELVSSYEEVRDKLWEIEDKIEDLRQAAIESYLSFEDRVMDAVVNKYQQEIDSYQAMSDAIEQANNEVLTSLREQIDLSRQIRDNTQKEEDIADMENRLAYLQRDTSGANALEIQKLQEDLEKARESYTDTLVDQAIEKMQNDADLAAEQRAKQIDIMQAQLDRAQETGELWSEVWDFMNAAAEGDGALSPYSSLVELLKDTEAFDSLSNIGKEKWWSEVAEQFHAAWVGKDEAEDKYNVDANGDGVIASSGTSSAIESVSESSSSVSTPSTSEHDTEGHDDATIAGVAMNICGPNNGWGDGDTRRERLAEKGFNPGEVQAIVNDIVNSGWDDSYYRRKYDIDSLSDYSYYAFKTGGLANFTGPAWLDGTKSKPELVLNAQDTANFIALKDILASLMSNFQNGNGSTVSESKQVNVNVEATISSDYDVDRLVDRVKHDIYQDGQYRNNTSIGYLR